ncbi:hypothetical protein U1Q18_019158 [Sarracenia purpurea var. burkii]
MEFEGVSHFLLRALGDNKVLISFFGVDGKPVLLDPDKVWLNRWFAAVYKWSDREANSSREVWVQVIGVPLHAWNEGTFISLGSIWAGEWGVVGCVQCCHFSVGGWIGVWIVHGS